MHTQRSISALHLLRNQHQGTTPVKAVCHYKLRANDLPSGYAEEIPEASFLFCMPSLDISVKILHTISLSISQCTHQDLGPSQSLPLCLIHLVLVIDHSFTTAHLALLSILEIQPTNQHVKYKYMSEKQVATFPWLF